MTKEEVKKKSAEKAKKIQDLCKELKMQIVPEQIVTEQGIIRTVVFYQDIEEYPEAK